MLKDIILVLHKLWQNKEGNTGQLIPWGQYCSNSKTRQKYHKKRNLQTKYLMRTEQSVEKWTDVKVCAHERNKRVSNKYMKRCSNKMCSIIHSRQYYMTLKWVWSRARMVHQCIQWKKQTWIQYGAIYIKFWNS